MRWQRLPDSLPLPAQLAKVNLTLAGTPIAQPVVDRGRLWLASRPDQQQQEDQALRIQVFRLLSQGVPVRLLTRLRLEVGGHGRMLPIAGLLPDGFQALSVTGPLAARWTGEQGMTIELKPGQWQIDVEALSQTPLARLAAPSVSADNWPGTELWAYRADPALPPVTVTGAASIDPSQTALPNEWHQFPTYLIKPTQSLEFNPEPWQQNPSHTRLELKRRLWLDFTGLGLTSADYITGTLDVPGRLNAQPETEVGRVMVNGQPRLVTYSAQGDAGVELRQAQVNLEAISRGQWSNRPLPVSGWRHTLDSVYTELHLPPGWRLLAVSDVDSAPSTWLAQWTLLDLFLLLIAIAAVARLWHPGLALLAGLSWFLIWQDGNAAPGVWLNWLAAAALLKVLPAGRALKWARGYWLIASVLVLGLVLPLLHQLAMTTLHPQLAFAASPAYQATLVSREDAMPDDLAALSASTLSAYTSKKARRTQSAASPVLLPDADAKVQTGPGVPDWTGTVHRLSWQGQVTPEQKFRLWLLTPALSKTLNILTFILLLLTVWRLVRAVWPWLTGRMPGATVALALPLVLLMTPMEPVNADYPSPELLTELRERLTQQPACAPECLSINRLDGRIDAKQLRLDLEIAAQTEIGLPLPSIDGLAFPFQVWLNRREIQSLVNLDGKTYLNLPEGIHQVTLTTDVSDSRRLTLSWPLSPRYTEFSAKDWRISGLETNGAISGALQFERILAEQSEQPGAGNVIAPFAQVKKTLTLSRDNWNLRTQIGRLSSDDRAMVLKWPLLPGESVLDERVVVDQGMVAVTLPAGVNRFTLQSALTPRTDLTLSAAGQQGFIEHWQVKVGPEWNLAYEGLPPINQNPDQGDGLAWRPWPGQQVTMTITRPSPAPGEVLTVQSSYWRIVPGAREQSESLSLHLLSSIGQVYRLNMPESAVLERLSIDGQRHSPVQDKQQLSIPLTPGEHRLEFDWHRPTAMTGLLRPSPPDLSLVGHNTRIELSLSPGRWLLWASGPQLGPSVLFWSRLVVLLIAAWALSRFKGWPLGFASWLALLLGLSQLPLAAIFLAVSWFVLIAWRARAELAGKFAYNFMQVATILLSLVFISLLLSGVEQGLLGAPDMQIRGLDSSARQLNWYQDRHPSALPEITVISAPLWLYRVLMLLWALWLAFALLNWFRWGWRVFIQNGLWRVRVKEKKSAGDAKLS